MPSPFPEIDSFLEDPDIFSDFHDSFLTHLARECRSGFRRPTLLHRPPGVDRGLGTIHRSGRASGAARTPRSPKGAESAVFSTAHRTAGDPRHS